MKLLVADIGAYQNYVSREFFYVMTALIRSHGWKHISAGRLCEPRGPLQGRLVREFGELPDVILFWEAYGAACTLLRELLELPCRRCILAADLHSWGDEAALIKHGVLYLFDRILAPYEYALDDFFPGLRAQKETVWVPHSASPDFLLPYNATPENSIFLSGAVNRYYPLRERMKALYDWGRYPIVYHPHPGYNIRYDYERNAGIGAGYAAKINRHLAAFTDSSRYRYLVAKHFEIPAAGALLVADTAVRTPLSRLGFVENVHYVSVSSESLEEQIQRLFRGSNRRDIDEIRRNGQQLVWNRHKTSDRASLIDHACTTSDVTASQNSSDVPKER